MTCGDANAAWLSKYNQLANAVPDLQKLLPIGDHRLVAYARTRYGLHFAWTILEIVFSYLFLQLGLSAALSARLRRIIMHPALHTAAFVVLFEAILWILSFPLSCFSSFGLKHYYGLSDQHFIDWLIDSGKAFAIGLVISTLVWSGIYWLLRRFTKGWPYLVFAASIPLTFAVAYAAPLLIDPVFNKIDLMPESALRRQIAQLATKAGIAGAPIFTADRSKQTKEVNAYVTGIGSSARIVIWDTTLQKLADDQILSVVAHETGHYVLKHVLKGCAIAVAISLIILPINLFVTPRLFKNAPKKWQISALDDVAALPAIVLIATIVMFWSEPLENTYCRLVESEADHYGYTLFPNKKAFITTFCALSKENLAEVAPPYMVKLWLFSHPPLGDRINAVQNDFR